MVDFSDTEEQAEWRKVVQTFIDEKLPTELREDQKFAGSLGGMHRGPLGNKKRVEVMKDWRKEILDRGWIAPAWPKEYGGADMGVMDQFIMKEVFNLDNGQYNKKNSYWRSYSIINEINKFKTHHKMNLEVKINKIYEEYEILSEKYQKMKNSNKIPLN